MIIIRIIESRRCFCPQGGLTEVWQAVNEMRLNQRMKRPGQRPAEWPSIAELDFAERVLVRAVRRLSVTNTETALVVPDLERFREEVIEAVGHGFGVFLGPRGGTGAAAELESMLRTFCCAGFRPLQIGGICEPLMLPDERFLLSFVAGCQAKDTDHVRNLLSWLLPPAGARIITAHGQSLAHIFHVGGLTLPRRMWLGDSIGLADIVPCHGEYLYTVH